MTPKGRRNERYNRQKVKSFRILQEPFMTDWFFKLFTFLRLINQNPTLPHYDVFDAPTETFRPIFRSDVRNRSKGTSLLPTKNLLPI